MHTSVKLLFNNINFFQPKKHLVFNYIKNNNISCALFVEAKVRVDQTVEYRNWSIINKPGIIINRNTRGGKLVLCHTSVNMSNANSPRINNPLNGCIHFSIPFQDDNDIFNVYIHPNSIIKETIFTMASLFKYALIIGNFNININSKKTAT